MKTTAIARIRQIRQSLFARFAGVQTSADHAPVSERKSAAVRQLYWILNNDSNVWVPTQVVVDHSTGVFARLRRGVSQRVSALTIRNPFSEESLERTKRAFSFSLIEMSMEKRQLLASFSYSSNLLTIQTDSANERLSIISTSENGNYPLTTSSGLWTGSEADITVSGGSLYVNQPSGLASILVNNNVARTRTLRLGLEHRLPILSLIRWSASAMPLWAPTLPLPLPGS